MEYAKQQSDDCIKGDEALFEQTFKIREKLFNNKEFLNSNDNFFEATRKKINEIIDDKISKRQEYNYKCLDILKELVDKYPDWRFTQIIFNLGLAEDRFYEESVDTYESMKMAIYKLEI